MAVKVNAMAGKSSDVVEVHEARRFDRVGGYLLAGLAGAIVGAAAVTFATKALPTVMSKAMRQMMAGMASAGGPCGDG